MPREDPEPQRWFKVRNGMVEKLWNAAAQTDNPNRDARDDARILLFHRGGVAHVTAGLHAVADRQHSKATAGRKIGE